MNYNQYIPTHILFGAGQLNNLTHSRATSASWGGN